MRVIQGKTIDEIIKYWLFYYSHESYNGYTMGDIHTKNFYGRKTSVFRFHRDCVNGRYGVIALKKQGREIYEHQLALSYDDVRFITHKLRKGAHLAIQRNGTEYGVEIVHDDIAMPLQIFQNILDAYNWPDENTKIAVTVTLFKQEIREIQIYFAYADYSDHPFFK